MSDCVALRAIYDCHHHHRRCWSRRALFLNLFHQAKPLAASFGGRHSVPLQDVRSRQRWSFPKEAEGRPSFGRTRFFQNKFASFGKPPPRQRWSFPKEAEGRRQRLSFFQKAARGEASFRNKFIKPPEVKLLSETSSAIECDRWRHPYLKHLAR